jgi:hypothetical protein
MRKENKFASLAAVCSGATLLLVLAGCAGIDVKSNDSDKSGKNVEISTPVGGLKVRKEVDLKALGLTPYPNARLAPDDENSKDDKDTGANVNISTPFFGLKVIAAKYESDDAPDKIIDFYKKDMARYGKVVQCKGSDYNASTDKGKDDDLALKLTCDEKDGDGNSITLKAGEGSSQHLVEVDPQQKGAHIGLVYIQMRGKAETM